MIRFPDPRHAPGDVVALGDDLRVETLREAYGKGIFPWPHHGMVLPWFSPRRRTILTFRELHVGRTLRRARQRSEFRFSIDEAFPAVIEACAASPRPGQDGTWIGPEIVGAYVRLHRAGDAHSVEVWEGDTLVGGLYGVSSGVFTGESMFHRRPEASKLALLHLVDHLASRGADWLDCQVMTPHMRALGARDISRGKFLDMLAAEQKKELQLF